MKNIDTEEFQKLAGEWRHAEESRNMAKASCAWQALVAHIEAWGAQQREAVAGAQRGFMLDAQQRAEKAEAAHTDDDRILRGSVPERWKGCASAIGAVQSYIAELEAQLAARPEVDLSAAMADTDQVPYLIVYDDTDKPDEPVIGGTRARYRYWQISASWNAHLYVKIASNSRDEKYPSARIEQLAARAVGGVDGLKAWRDLSRDEVRQIIRKWEHVGEDGMGLFLRFKQAAAAPVVDGDERALTDKGLLNWLENQDHVHALKWRCGENVKTALHDRDRKIIGEGPTLREAVRAAITRHEGTRHANG